MRKFQCLSFELRQSLYLLLYNLHDCAFKRKTKITPFHKNKAGSIWAFNDNDREKLQFSARIC